MHLASTPWLAWPLMLLVGLVIGLISSGCAALGSAIALRKFRRLGADAPWMERARWAFPARSAMLSNTWLLPTGFGAAGAILVSPILGLSPRAVGVLWAMLAWAGVRLQSQRLERLLTRRPSTPVGRRSAALRWLLVASQLLAWGLIFALIPYQWGPFTLAILALGAALMLFSIFGGWLAVCRWAGMLPPAPPRLLAIVARASALTGIPVKGVDRIDSTTANALALPLIGRLLFTDPILDALDDDELTAVAVHELAHLDEPLSVKLTRIAGAMLLPALVAVVPLVGTFGPIMILVAPTVVLLVVLVVNRVARRMEVRSDRLGHKYEGDPGTYAHALEKIYEANLVPAVLKGKIATHPNLYDRMIAAGVEPAYARPAPPKASGLAGLPTIALLTALATACVLPFALPDVFSVVGADDLATRQARALADAARERVEARDFNAAETLYRRAETLDRASPTYPALLAMLLSNRGRCEEARIQLDMARSRIEEFGHPEDYEARLLLKQAESTVDDCHPATVVPKPGASP